MFALVPVFLKAVGDSKYTMKESDFDVDAIEEDLGPKGFIDTSVADCRSLVIFEGDGEPGAAAAQTNQAAVKARRRTLTQQHTLQVSCSSLR